MAWNFLVSGTISLNRITNFKNEIISEACNKSLKLKNWIISSCKHTLTLSSRSQEAAAKDYFSAVANYTRKLDPTRPITIVLNQV
jgi:hypothetical protein